MTLVTSFADLLKETKHCAPIKVALPFPYNDHVLLSLYEATEAGIIDPYIVGEQKIIEKVAAEYEVNISKFNKTYVNNDICLSTTIDLVTSKVCDVLMKGDCTTADLMSWVLKKSTNLRTDSIVSHVYVLELPTYHKLLFITDAAINIAPSIPERIKITKNAILLGNALGISTPKIAILSALETVNLKMTSTYEAKTIATSQELQNISIIEGPLAFDNAINKEAADIKHIQSMVAGDVDILVVPNIEAGNILAKSLIYLGGAKAAGLVLGAKIPIILTSRADTIESKVLSTALAALYAREHGIDMRTKTTNN